MVDGDEFGAIRKSCLDLDIMNHFGNAFHDIIASQQRGSITHEHGDRLPIARAFQQCRCDEGHGLRMIQFQSPLTTPPGEIAGHDDEEFFLFTGRQMHQLVGLEKGKGGKRCYASRQGTDAHRRLCGKHGGDHAYDGNSGHHEIECAVGVEDRGPQEIELIGFVRMIVPGMGGGQRRKANGDPDNRDPDAGTQTMNTRKFHWLSLVPSTRHAKQERKNQALRKGHGLNHKQNKAYL